MVVKTFKKWSFVALLLISSVAANPLSHAEGQGSVDPVKKKEIERVLQLTGVMTMMEQMVDKMVTTSQTAPASNQLPPEFWSQFRKRMNLQALIDEIIPVYDKHYSLEDLKVMNEFYSTPAGQRLLSTMPQIMSESMAIGQKWGKDLGEEVLQDMARAQAGR